MTVPPAGPEESAKFLSGLAQARGIGGANLAGLDFGALLPFLLKNPELLMIILGLLKNASGGGAGTPGELPTPPPPPPPPVPVVPPKEEADDVPDGRRSFKGLKGNYGNHQRGKSGGGVRPDSARGVEVFEKGANIYGPEKTKFIGYFTPVMSDGEGLQPGDDENEDIEVDHYGLEFDGKRFVGDEMKNLGEQGILVNNMDSSNGLNPRVVIDGMSGNHTVALFMSVNGHEHKLKTLNIKGQA